MPLAKLSLPNPLDDTNTNSILNAGLLSKPNEDKNSGTSDLLLASLLTSGSGISNSNASNRNANAPLITPFNPTEAVTGIANAVGITKIGGELVDKLFPSEVSAFPGISSTGNILPEIPGVLSGPAIGDISEIGTKTVINAPTSIFTKAKILASTPIGTGALAAIPSLLKGDIKGGIGSGLGAASALALVPGSPIIAPIIGGILGKKVFKGITKKLGIGGGSSVGKNAGGSALVGEGGELVVGPVGADNKGDTGFVTSFLTNVAKTVNTSLNESGDKLQLPVNSRPLFVEVIKGKLNVYDAPGSFKSFNPNEVDQAFNYAVSLTLKGKKEANVHSPESNKITSELDKKLLEIFGKVGK